MSVVSVVCCQVEVCDGLITRPGESYRLWRVVVCDLETSKEEAKSPLKGCEYKPTMGRDDERKKILQINSALLHVSAAHADIFRPALDRTSTFDVRTIWEPRVFTYM